ncbi:hypothetical protein BJ170DRAFT_660160 [Xylariales sp. AK1849]|nr:hypothetical protein BJ170DRAFT_660160 [Xylariales sp. AK1849]
MVLTGDSRPQNLPTCLDATNSIKQNDAFADIMAPQFPSLLGDNYDTKTHKLIEHVVENIQWPDVAVTESTVLRTALATLISWQEDTSDTIFGVEASYRHVSRPLLTEPRARVVPLRVVVDGETTIQQLLEAVQRRGIEMRDCSIDQISVQENRLLSEEAERACRFQILLLAQPLSLPCGGDSTGEAVVIGYHLDDSFLHLQMAFNSAIVSEQDGRRMLEQLEHILHQLCSNTTARVKDMSRACDEQLDTIWEWNAQVPDTVKSCVHELIAERVNQTPNAPAVAAWDGNLTYSQLNDFSSRLATKLVDIGVGPGTYIPLCSEKSIWVPVAMLAVMKAGGASVLLDVEQPENRLQTIIDQLAATIVISSVAGTKLAANITSTTTFVLGQACMDELPESTTPLPPVDPSSPICLIFTSGSTGAPKGVSLTHEGFCSAIKHQQQILGFSHETRLYDFVSYAFDVAWGNMVHTLAVGGCLCIPSQEDRKNDISGSINRGRANHVVFTPVVARVVDPSTLPTVRKVTFTGESMTREDVARWPNVEICNAYGPAECTVWSTIGLIDQHQRDAPSIGRGAGVVTWVVQQDGEQLAPIGSVGELWLEGPIVGRGYFKNAEKTAAAFAEDPPWLLQGSPGIPETQRVHSRRGRLYKTGDLVRYNSDGSLLLLGRKDNQVKIRGQRTELGDIEHHIRRLLPDDAVHVVVETITPKSTGIQTLAAFITMPGAVEKVASILNDLEAELSKRIPVWMVPSLYIPLKTLPITATGKIDRRALRETSTLIDPRSVLGDAKHSENEASLTADESKLRSLWASVLGTSPESITADDSFLRLGGHSITAMHLVAAARRDGLSLTVGNILRQPRLKELALLMGHTMTKDGNNQQTIEPFSLLKSTTSTEEARRQVADLCHVNPAVIEDIFPCTALQEGLLAATAKQSAHYISRIVVELRPGVDTDRLHQAWKEVSEDIAPILRTRIVDLPGQGLVQAVLKEQIPWDMSDSTSAIYQTAEMGLGTPLTRLGIVNAGEKMYLAWAQHHAVYDGWSLPLIEKAVTVRYQGEQPEPLVAFQPFIKYLNESTGHAAFWKEQFSDFEATTFPILPTNSYQSYADKSIEHVVRNIEWPQDVTSDIVIRSAWATLLSWYGESADTVFGVVVSGRKAPVPGIERLAGPTIATVPLRVIVEGEATLEELQQKVHQQAIRMVPFEQMGLQNIRRVSEEAERGCQFQSLLVIQPAIESDRAPTQSPIFERGVIFQSGVSEQDQTRVEAPDLDSIGVDMFDTYGITLVCQGDGRSLHLNMEFDSNILSEQAARRMSHQFDHILHQFCRTDMASTKISDIDIVTKEDLRQIWDWNTVVPAEVHECIHDLIAESTRRHPEKTAICAWDGELTYAQLNDLSTRLAYRLIQKGVRPGTLVPLCFEKSKCMPIAQIAVMKAGAASVTIDPSQTKKRLKYITEYIGSELIVCAPSTASLIADISGREPFVVQAEIISEFPQHGDDEGFEVVLPCVKPSDLLYVVFTSGSTGDPKGAMVTHANFAAAVKHQKSLLHFKSTSRVADFSSYAFDASWANFIHTIAAGGCLCIPSEYERQHDFVQFLTKQQVNYVDLTPSVAAFLELDRVPTLETLILGGELIDFDKLPHVRNIERTIITYGPAECTVNATGLVSNGDPAKATIGFGTGTSTWIVNPSKDSLMPIGLIGELLVEGPLVGKGYLNNPEKTAASFIEDPSWLLRGGPGADGRHGRLYRTGDLVRYNDAGELIFAGRKDTQVKIRGHRTDLSDIEHHIIGLLQSTSEVADVVVEVVTPKVTPRQILVAFLRMTGVSEKELTRTACPIIEILEKEVIKGLPAYMIPSAYMPRTELPLTATGKTDRKALREIGAMLDLEALSSLYRPNSVQHIEPTTESEVLLRSLWASILHLPLNEIGTQDNFLRLGGDSIAAMRLAAAVRREGITLTVPTIFHQPQLSDMAKLISQSEEVQATETVEPFSLLKPNIDKYDACRQVAESCSIGDVPEVDPSQIEDIFPCTALQEGLLAMTARSSGGDYVQYLTAELKPEIDLLRFQKAWEKVSVKASVLRTRIVHLPGQGWVQVVLREPLQWQTYSSLDEYHNEQNAEKDLLGASASTVIGPGTPLSKFGIIHDEAGKRYLAWTQHHAVYDGWCVSLLQTEVERAYQEEEVELSSVSLQRFVKHVMTQHSEEGTTFWKRQFEGTETSHFPTLPEQMYQPKADKIIDHSVSSIRWPARGITPSSVIRTAWATLLSWYVDSPDIAFGAVVSGRQAPVPGIEEVAGPTIATVPLRVLVHGTVDQLLYQVQRQATDMLPFEQLGLQYIRRVNQEAEHICNFQTLLVVQPPTENSNEKSFVFETDLTEQEHGAGSFNTYAIMLTCQMSDANLHLQMSFDSVVVEEETATRLLYQLEHILDQLSSIDGSTDINDLSRVSQRDMSDIWDWNATVPATVKGRVHDIFARRVSEDPEATAVCAWDGELTYGKLDELSTLLACHLVGSVGPGTVVPLYFEKSMWMSVAVLSVMKAGAASVLLDATLPQYRLKTIVSQVSATVILTSASCHSLAAQITDVPVVEVASGAFDRLQLSNPKTILPEVCPSSPLYIVFTSGSTGLPKGATVTHTNFCSAIRHQQQQLGVETSSRVLDYTSYAFDVAWSNILHTLTAGGCLCVPSEDDRTSDVVGSINRLRANVVPITPTVARLIDPAALQGVKKFMFLGEALKAADVTRWEGSGVEIYNYYGPSECSVVSAVEKVDLSQMSKPSCKPSDPGIGVAVGALAWIVQPHAPDRLAAIGTVGELWIEGPIVGAGYWKDSEKTANAFIEDPKWLLQGYPPGVPGRRGRLYRTGDLVFYKPDRSLGFIGRKGTQVKINGQRIELGEVEYHVRQLLPAEAVSQVVAELIAPEATQRQTLAIFLTISKVIEGDNLEESTAPMIANLLKELSKRLPSYMVPSAYIPLRNLPMTPTGKTNRLGLRGLGKSYIPPVVMSPDVPNSDVPLTRTEETLRDTWASLLDIKSSLISTSHSFLEVGGDSIKTMSLAMEIRKQWNINIGVRRLVGQRHSLRELAVLIDNLRQGQDVKEPIPINLEKEIERLSSKLQCGPTASASTVFLTGSTGFLGTQILRHILTKRAFDRVVVPVRIVNGQRALDRVRSAAKIAGWWDESFASAIEAWDGDLSAERLGLNESQWNALCGLPSTNGTIHAIIHNGAAVHWSTSYDSLKAVNVDSTMQLLQAAMASPFMKSFVYVSGGITTDKRRWTEKEANEATGYDQTKYVSERLVSAAAAAAKCYNQGTKFSIVKPGQIIGDVDMGVANPDDFLWRIVITATRLGCRPTEPVTSWLSISDVCHISELIIWHAMGKNKEDFVNVTRGMLVSCFWAAVENQLQLQLRPVSWDEWIEIAKQSMERERELHALWPVQHFLGALGTEITADDRSEWEMQEVVTAARRNVAYLQDMGLIGTEGGYGQPMDGKVMTRTRNIVSRVLET